MPKKDYIIYLHKDTSIGTLEELCSPTNLTSLLAGYNPMALLAYKDELGERNIEKIVRKYPPNVDDILGEQVDAKKEADLAVIEGLNEKDLATYPDQPQTQYIWPGCELAIPISALNRNVLIGESSNLDVSQLSKNEFLVDELNKLLKDKEYFPIGKISLTGIEGRLISQFPDATVWLWVRSFSDSFDENLEGEIINITPFVKNISVNQTKNGGVFSISLSPITCYWQGGKWFLDRDVLKYQNLGEKNILSVNHLYAPDGRRNNFYFHNLVTENDIVFIRFETLVKEAKDRIGDNSQFIVDKSNLPDKIYDFIGLVDRNGINLNSSNSETAVDIQISGRDLSKLLIEDGCFFYPLDFVPGGIFANDRNESLLDRIDGKIYSITQEAEKSIGYSLRFIFNALTNIGICSDNLFYAYGDRRTKKFPTKSNDIAGNKYKLIGDRNKIKQFVINDIKKSTPSGTNYNYLFDSLVDFITQLINENKLTIVGRKVVDVLPTVFRGENLASQTTPLVFKDAGYFLYRQSTASVAGVFEQVGLISSTEPSTAFQKTYEYITSSGTKEDIIREEGEVLTHGIWQIIKLVVDDEIFSRRLVDNSIGNENGSIMNYIDKVCQRPWVEFWGDTYGDQYYFTATVPIFNKKGIRKFIDEVSLFTIKEEDIINDSLAFSENCYSWYKIQPQSVLEGGGDDIVWAYLKAIHFQEFAYIWGERPLEVIIPYIPHFNISKKDEKFNISYAVKQYLYDLQFLIEINAYLPFTREGQITIVGGDRRLKIGTWFRYEGTGEIFYINQISHSLDANSNRTTTISVERGMVEKYWEEYFNIVDIFIDEAIFSDQDPNKWIENISGKWKVNKEKFNFFLRRQQFIPEYQDNRLA